MRQQALTVGQLREVIANLPDSVEVVIDTDGWYDNIQGVIVPMSEVDNSEYVCLTLIPSSMNDPYTRHGDWDCRQGLILATIPADVTISGEAQ